MLNLVMYFLLNITKFVFPVCNMVLFSARKMFLVHKVEFYVYSWPLLSILGNWFQGTISPPKSICA